MLYTLKKCLKTKFNLSMTISRCALVNPSTLYSNINVVKTIKFFLWFRKSLKNGCNNLYFESLFEPSPLSNYHKTKFISDVNPHFFQYQADTNNDRFTCCLENHLKMTAIISICTLIPLI